MSHDISKETAMEPLRRCAGNAIADEIEQLEVDARIEVSEISDDNSFLIKVAGRGVVIVGDEDHNGRLIDIEVCRFIKKFGIDGLNWTEVDEYEPHRPQDVDDRPIEMVLKTDAMWLVLGESGIA